MLSAPPIRLSSLVFWSLIVCLYDGSLNTKTPYRTDLPVLDSTIIILIITLCCKTTDLTTVLLESMIIAERWWRYCAWVWIAIIVDQSTLTIIRFKLILVLTQRRSQSSLGKTIWLKHTSLTALFWKTIQPVFILITLNQTAILHRLVY